MTQLRLHVTKSPSSTAVYSNVVVVNAQDIDARQTRYIQVITGPAHRYLFKIENHGDVRQGEIGFTMPQRKWASISLTNDVTVEPFSFHPQDPIITGMSLLVDYQTKPKS